MTDLLSVEKSGGKLVGHWTGEVPPGEMGTFETDVPALTWRATGTADAFRLNGTNKAEKDGDGLYDVRIRADGEDQFWLMAIYGSKSDVSIVEYIRNPNNKYSHRAILRPKGEKPVIMDLGDGGLEDIPADEHGERFAAELTKPLEQLSGFTGPLVTRAVTAEAILRDARDLMAKGARLSGEGEHLEAYSTTVAAADLYSRVFREFPDHAMALKAQLLAGHAHRNAQKYVEALSDQSRENAIKALNEAKRVGSGDPMVIAEVMYMSADALVPTTDSTEARSERVGRACETFRELAEKYPDTTWAKYARGRLAQLASEESR